MVAFLLTGGIVSDRTDRRYVLIGADLVRAAALVGMGVLSLSGVLEVWHLVALAAFIGVGEAFFGPAFGALIPTSCIPSTSSRANALDQLVRQAAERLIGPALGGFVVADVGAGTGFLVDAAPSGRARSASRRCACACARRSGRAPRDATCARA
jgi:MFS family permease